MLPRVILHVAISLDGKVTGFVPDMAQHYGVVSSFEEDVTLAGADTLLNAGKMNAWELEDEETEVAEAPLEAINLPPLLVIDSQGRLRHWQALRASGYWSKVVALCSNTTPSSYLEYLKQQKVPYHIRGKEKVDLKATLELLGNRYEARTVRVESGAALNSALLEAGLVNELSLVVHPALVGKEGLALFAGEPVNPLELNLIQREKLEKGLLWLRYEL